MDAVDILEADIPQCDWLALSHVIFTQLQSLRRLTLVDVLHIFKADRWAIYEKLQALWCLCAILCSRLDSYGPHSDFLIELSFYDGHEAVDNQ